MVYNGWPPGHTKGSSENLIELKKKKKKDFTCEHPYVRLLTHPV